MAAPKVEYVGRDGVTIKVLEKDVTLSRTAGADGVSLTADRLVAALKEKEGSKTFTKEKVMPLARKLHAKGKVPSQEDIDADIAALVTAAPEKVKKAPGAAKPAAAAAAAGGSKSYDEFKRAILAKAGIKDLSKFYATSWSEYKTGSKNFNTAVREGQEAVIAEMVRLNAEKAAKAKPAKPAVNVEAAYAAAGAPGAYKPTAANQERYEDCVAKATEKCRVKHLTRAARSAKPAGNGAAAKEAALGAAEALALYKEKLKAYLGSKSNKQIIDMAVYKDRYVPAAKQGRSAALDVINKIIAQQEKKKANAAAAAALIAEAKGAGNGASRKRRASGGARKSRKSRKTRRNRRN